MSSVGCNPTGPTRPGARRRRPTRRTRTVPTRSCQRSRRGEELLSPRSPNARTSPCPDFCRPGRSHSRFRSSSFAAGHLLVADRGRIRSRLRFAGLRPHHPADSPHGYLVHPSGRRQPADRRAEVLGAGLSRCGQRWSSYQPDDRRPHPRLGGPMAAWARHDRRWKKGVSCERCYRLGRCSLRFPTRANALATGFGDEGAWLRNIPAATYSPRGLPPKYHRRGRP